MTASDFSDILHSLNNTLMPSVRHRLNMLITLMGDLFKTIKDKQEVVFLKNRAGEKKCGPGR